MEVTEGLKISSIKGKNFELKTPSIKGYKLINFVLEKSGCSYS